ncbi:MAG: hypothetical protein LBM28_05065 [Oscillospiraceae bacterium]|jgi:hypothetical protein|nr:hypothetical protein [Oscillospiraceae bacterium]
MKKFQMAFVTITLAFILSACVEHNATYTPQSTDPSLPSASTEQPSQIPEHQKLTSTVLSKASLNVDEGMTIDLPEVGLTGLLVKKEVEGFPVNFNDHPLSSYILSDYRYGTTESMHDSYLAVETGESVHIYDFGNSSLDDNLYMCDVDGDQMDEIVVQQIVDAFGTPGQYSSLIFKIEDEGIRKIYDFRIFDSDDTYSGCYDTGYYSELKDGFVVEISNRFTDYSIDLDFTHRKDEISWYFDKNGKPVKQIEEILCSSFYDFQPTDTDGDGIYEIEVTQLARSLLLHGALGDVKTVLKYEPQTQEFKVIEAEFIPAE